MRDAFPPPMCVWVVVFIHLRMETPLRGRSGGHIGTAPTVSFGWIACGWLMSFGQVARGMGDSVWGGLCVVLFVCWENGAHEPTPSALYFLKSIFVWGKSFANNPFAACDDDV